MRWAFLPTLGYNVLLPTSPVKLKTNGGLSGKFLSKTLDKFLYKGFNT